MTHLAVTGSVAIGDGLIQQALGHGLASRLSAKLGEGVLNGFLTARLGLAALDVIRPLPFAALPRPVLTDLIKDLTRSKGRRDVSNARARSAPSSLRAKRGQSSCARSAPNKRRQ